MAARREAVDANSVTGTTDPAEGVGGAGGGGSLDELGGLVMGSSGLSWLLDTKLPPKMPH